MMQLTYLCWLTVTMAFSLFAGSLAVIDKNKLSELIKEIRTEVTEGKDHPMYAVAVSIQDDYKLLDEQKLTPKDRENIRNGVVVNKDEFVIATKKDHEKFTEHAEWRVLEEFDIQKAKGKLLVIFSYASSCPSKCSDPEKKYSIIEKLGNVKNTGKEYAFVFEKIFLPRNGKIERKVLEQALKNIGGAINLENVFRCYKPKNEDFRCISCKEGEKVKDECVSYTA